MQDLRSKIESVLFVSSTPLSRVRLAKMLDAGKDEITQAIAVIKEKWNTDESGVFLIENGDDVQLMSRPENAEVVSTFLKDETSGELTRPALETLSIIAYRQPITKPELEQIRGVNCSLIVRNLLMRGLIEEKEDGTRMQVVYSVTVDFVRLLGLSSLEDLPEYQILRVHPFVQDMLAAAAGEHKEPPA